MAKVSTATASVGATVTYHGDDPAVSRWVKSLATKAAWSAPVKTASAKPRAHSAGVMAGTKSRSRLG